MSVESGSRENFWAILGRIEQYIQKTKKRVPTPEINFDDNNATTR